MSSLYVHLPFCTQKCHYCDFVITTNKSELYRERVLNALSQEIRYLCEKYGSRRIETLYFGGGTPSILSSQEFEELVKTLSSHFSWSKSAEFAIELNPEDCTREKLKHYRTLGVSRVSLGVQSFEDETLKKIGRAHGTREIYQAIDFIRSEGFENFNLDLICRLPGVSPAQWQKTLKKAISFAPTHLSIYDLEIHTKTLFGYKEAAGALSLPTTEDHYKMILDAVEILRAAGFKHYEIANFSKPGFESKHNLNYWKNGEYYGFGPGAYSYLDQKRFRNAATVKRYLEKFEELQAPEPDEVDKLTAEQIEVETLITGLRLEEGMNLNQFDLIRTEVEENMKSLIDEEMMIRTEDNIKLTHKGRFLAEQTFMRLIPEAKSSS